MKSSADPQTKIVNTRSWRSLLMVVLLGTAFIYVWILPLFRPRGEFLWGHYRLQDIYAGIPIALAAFAGVLILAAPKRYRRPFALRVTTVAIGILLAIALADAVFVFGVMGALRPNYWLDQAHIPRMYSAADPELGFVRKPSVSWQGYVPDVNRFIEYRTDKNGFRNSTEQQHANIVFIGDSFTEAGTVGEAETFVRRVAQSTGLSAVNLGRGAYSPQQELIVLQRYGVAYQPRFVVWQLFEGNDLADARAFAEWKKNPRQVNSSLKDRYFDNSMLNYWLTRTRLQEPVGPRATLRYHDGTSRRVSLRYPYDPKEPLTNRVGMIETVRAIEAGHQLCESRGVQLLVLLVPTMVRAMAPLIHFDVVEDRKRYVPELTEGQKDFSRTVEELCDRIGCDFVDASGALRRATDTNNRGLYIPNNEHLDVGGHDVMAQIVTDWLRSKAVSHPSE